jgi:hypothetical protein
MSPPLPTPTLQAVRKTLSLISSGDHSRLETRRITAVTVPLKPGRLNPFFRIRFLVVGFAHAVLDCFTIPLDEFPELLGGRQGDQIA